MKTTIQALLVMMAFAFFSCNKQNGLDSSTTTTDLSKAQLKSATIAVNDVAVEGVSEEANYEAEFYSGYEHLLRDLAHFKGRKGDLLAEHAPMHYANGKIPVVSIDTTATVYPITITIDYGTSTETNHGRLINGKVIIVISGAKDTDGSTSTISYIGCKIDSIGIEGHCVEIFNGDNVTTRKTTTISEVKFTLANGTVIDRNGNEVHEWLKGVNTPNDRNDDMIQITGSIDVKSSTGDTYSRTITKPLIQLGDCRDHVQGTVQYSQNNVVIAQLDYGDGTCDTLANLTTNGATVEIQLKGFMPKAMTEGQHKGMPHGKGK